MTINTYLCVGGPYDGKHHIEPNNYTLFNVVSIPKLPVVSEQMSDTLAPKMEHCTYVLDSVYFDRRSDADITFWRLDSDTTHEALIKLFKNYYPKKDDN